MCENANGSSNFREGFAGTYPECLRDGVSTPIHLQSAGFVMKQKTNVFRR